jgi:MYXO-CTERM domain-containing protein
MKTPDARVPFFDDRPFRRSSTPRSWPALVGTLALVALALAWRTRLRRRSARIQADEARMEPIPVVY